MSWCRNYDVWLCEFCCAIPVRKIFSAVFTVIICLITRLCTDCNFPLMICQIMAKFTDRQISPDYSWSFCIRKIPVTSITMPVFPISITCTSWLNFFMMNKRIFYIMKRKVVFCSIGFRCGIFMSHNKTISLCTI